MYVISKDNLKKTFIDEKIDRTHGYGDRKADKSIVFQIVLGNKILEE
jgi:hypothetical protein